MKLKGLIEEDFCNYKKTSMFLIFPYCSFKCDHECGRAVCQNSALAKEQIIDVSMVDLINKYCNNPITKSIVFGGLEPFDSWNELCIFILLIRLWTQDDIVIYTGYKNEEIQGYIRWLKQFPNIVIKFGRFVPDQEPHYDEVLGIELASQNQYAEKIS